jgi:Uncharacterized proteins of the AP superfamily
VTCPRSDAGLRAAVPLLPAYGEAALSDLPESVLAALGVGEHNPLALDPARRICVLLIDGLGEEQLRAHADVAPFLAGLGGRILTAGFPPTTVTSLATLGTGMTPGEHGMLGVMVAVPGEGRLLNCLRWRTHGPAVDPEDWQPATTVYQRAWAAGVRASYVAPAAFDGTGLTRAVYRGVRYIGSETVDDRVAAVRRELADDGGGEAVFVTVYYGDVDTQGHRTGMGSPEWRAELAVADRLAERLAAALPPGSALYVIADHGMVNVTDRVDVDALPALLEGVALLGGDFRCRYIYTEPGATRDVLAAWREVLAGRAWVVERADAVAAGWFGPRVRPEWLGRIGDVIAVPYGECAVVAARRDPRGAAMVGMHGSLTSAELRVPLLEVSTR